ncbi:hypothetical protein [Bacillus mycoides]|uniref:hypothetical protein n=1 Tax=Bacillus mycoides TaxID=1405 RepID=UPI000816108D|nr:hypothetical protein [Bacillus mycoides]SCC02503.1 Uncharacterized protein BW664_01154 [Bacillus mycoides]
MPIIKDIQLSLLKKYTDNLGEESAKNISELYEDETFFKQTRCITSLYSRLLPRLVTKYEKGILIHCLEDMDLLNESERACYVFPEYINIFGGFDSEKYFSFTSDREKKELALNLIHGEMKTLAEQYNWDLEALEGVYNKIVDLNYTNHFIYKKKSSTNKKYMCSIICEHEVSYADIYLEIRTYRSKKLIKKELLVREKETYETEIFSHVGNIKWTLDHKVTIMDERNQTGWMLTFLEKEHISDLIWKLERIKN